MHLKTTLTFILPALVSTMGLAQLQLDWAFSTGSKVSDLTGTTRSDHEDNLYVMSFYRDTVDLDPSPGTYITFPASSHVVTLSKYDSEGGHQWTGSFWDKDDLSGAIYEIRYNRIRLSLTFTDSLIYQLHGQKLIDVGFPGVHTCFLDLSLDGAVLRANFFQTPDPFYFTDIISLPNGQTLVGGAFVNSFSFPGFSQPLVSSGEYDAMIALLDEDMQPIWTTSFGSAMGDFIQSVFYTDDGTIYFTLVNEGTVVMETAQGQLTFPSNGEDNNVYGYMDLTGEVQNAFGFGGDFGDQIREIVADEDQNMYVCGYFEGTVNFAHALQAPVMHTSTAQGDGFIAKYNSEGLLIWERIYTTEDYGGVYGISLKRGSELYAHGGVTGRSDLDPGPDSMIVYADTRTDIFVSKLTLDGELLYSYHFPGNEVEGIRDLIASTGTSRVYLQGFFYDSLDCDFSSGEQWVVSLGGSDAFMMGFTEDNVISAVSTTSDFALTVYPNPTSDFISLKSEDPILEVMIISADGQVISHIDGNGSTFLQVDLEALLSGLYFIRTYTENGQNVSRIIRF